MNETTLTSLLEFARGPLFRFTFALLVLGCARLVVLTVYNIIKTYLTAGDKAVAWDLVRKRTLWWLFPFARLTRTRSVYSIVSFIWHVGLIITPIFLFGHVHLWKQGTGLAWPTLSNHVADVLTVVTIVAGLWLLVGRIASPLSRTMSRPNDFLWPVLLTIPFLSGLFIRHPSISPMSYQAMMLIHVLSGELIFVLIPFSKVAHCVLMPFSQLVSEMGWRFPATAGRDVARALHKESAPI